jgi:hypothetical protein
MEPEGSLPCSQDPTKSEVDRVSFRDKLVFTVRSCYALVPPQSWKVTPYRLSATAYSICSQLLSISGGRLLYPRPKDVTCHGDRDPHNITYKYNK